MSAPSPIVNYIVEIPKDDPRRTIHGFSPYSPSPVSPAAVREALAEKDLDLASNQLAHYWLQTDRWIRRHNTEVEEAEKKRRDEEDLRKVEEKKRAEIEEDWRRRAELTEKEQRELEQRRKEKGKGRATEDSPEGGPSRPRKRRAESESEGRSAKRPKQVLAGLGAFTDSVV